MRIGGALRDHDAPLLLEVTGQRRGPVALARAARAALAAKPAPAAA